MANDALQMLVVAAIANIVAVGVVIALRPFVRRLSGARVTYAMWLLVPFAVIATLLPAPQASESSPPIVAYTVGDTPVGVHVPDATPAGITMPAGAWLLLWGAGALASVMLAFARQRRAVRALGMLDDLGDGVHASRRRDVGPMLVGVFAPRIIVPSDFDLRFTPRERALVLAHERHHRDCGDPVVNLIASAWRGLFWFDPVTWWAASRLRVDQELSCDAAVLDAYPGERHAYAEALLKAQAPVDVAPFACAWTRHPLHARIRAIGTKRPVERRRRIGATCVAIITGVAACLSWAAQPARTAAVGEGAGGEAIEVALQVLIDGRTSDDATVERARVLAPSAGRPARFLVQPGEAIGLSIGTGDQRRVVSARFWRENDTITMRARLTRAGALVGEPFLEFAPGRTGSVAVAASTDDAWKIEVTAWPARDDAAPSKVIEPRAMRLELVVDIDAQGRVVDARLGRIVSSSGGEWTTEQRDTLVAAALKAVRQWIWPPPDAADMPPSGIIERVVPMVMAGDDADRG